VCWCSTHFFYYINKKNRKEMSGKGKPAAKGAPKAASKPKQAPVKAPESFLKKTQTIG